MFHLQSRFSSDLIFVLNATSTKMIYDSRQEKLLNLKNAQALKGNLQVEVSMLILGTRKMTDAREIPSGNYMFSKPHK